VITSPSYFWHLILTWENVIPNKPEISYLEVCGMRGSDGSVDTGANFLEFDAISLGV